MKQYNCKNCGAPIEHLYNHKCPYCDTMIDFNLDKKDIEEIDWHNVAKIEFIDSYREIYSSMQVLKFKCTQYNPIQFIETNNYYSLAKIPDKKEFYFAIRIDEIDFYHFNNELDFIREVLFARIPNRDIANMAFYDYMKKEKIYE